MSRHATNPRILFDKLVINHIHHASGVFIGINKQIGWKAHNKENLGWGTVSGERNLVQYHSNIVCDQDKVDSPL